MLCWQNGQIVITASAPVSLIILAFSVDNFKAISGWPDFIPPPAPQHWLGFSISTKLIPLIFLRMSLGSVSIP